jgi:hypothetical protein
MNNFLRTLLFLPPQASSVARRIDQLHFIVITATKLGALLVPMVCGWFVVSGRTTTLWFEARTYDLQGRGARERLPEPEPPGGGSKK